MKYLLIVVVLLRFTFRLEHNIAGLQKYTPEVDSSIFQVLVVPQRRDKVRSTSSKV